MLIKNTYIITIFILFIYANSFAQEFVKVPDTTMLHNGSTYRLPIYANLQLNSVNDIETTFEFDYTLINITSVFAEPNNIIANTKPQFSVISTDFKKGFLTINANKFNLSNNNILCFVELETLFGLDSIAYFKPTFIKINGQEKNEIIKESGKINVGFALEPIIKEGISKVFPNPFDSEFIVDFAIETQTEITFTIFSSLGRVVYSFPNKTNEGYRFFDSKGNLINEPYKMKFPKGYYKLRVKSVPWHFSSGLYFLQMSTQNGIFNTNILHLK